MAKKRVIIKTYINTDGTTVTHVEGMKGRGCLSLTKNIVNALSVDGDDIETVECDSNAGFSQRNRDVVKELMEKK